MSTAIDRFAIWSYRSQPVTPIDGCGADPAGRIGGMNGSFL